jgi:sugar lactone lactonase YvrE
VDRASTAEEPGAPQTAEVEHVDTVRVATAIQIAAVMIHSASIFDEHAREGKEDLMTRLRFRGIRRTLRAFALLAVAAAPCAAQKVTEITLPGTRVFPESITSTPDGTLIVGSLGHGDVLRIAPGKTDAVEWIKAGTNGLNSVLGVFADEKNKLLWVCSNKLGPTGDPTAVKTFDLKTGAAKDSYPLPGDRTLCNDIAVAPDGTAYITDTFGGAVDMLKPGAKALDVAAKDPLLAGADGLAFTDKTTLYVNSVTANKILRVTLGADGKSTGLTDLKLPRALDRPDGMRALGNGRLLLAENSGKMSLVSFDGDSVMLTTLKEVSASTPAVTATKGMAWVAEGKLNYMQDPAMKDQDPGTFKMYAVPLPK